MHRHLVLPLSNKPITGHNIIPNGFAWLALHPFDLQGLVLFWVGTGIQFLELVWYSYSLTRESVDVKLPKSIKV
jgi:hypothetical protein